MAHRHPVCVFHAPKTLLEHLDDLCRRANKSRSAVLRFLILTATPDVLPSAWRDLPDGERRLISIAERGAAS